VGEIQIPTGGFAVSALEDCQRGMTADNPERGAGHSIMLTKNKPKEKKKAALKRVNRPVGRELFWVHPGHPDLDRAGDFLLSNLGEIRLESVVRGPAH